MPGAAGVNRAVPNSLLELGGEENPPGLAQLMTGNVPRCAKYGYRLFRSIHDSLQMHSLSLWPLLAAVCCSSPQQLSGPGLTASIFIGSHGYCCMNTCSNFRICGCPLILFTLFSLCNDEAVQQCTLVVLQFGRH